MSYFPTDILEVSLDFGSSQIAVGRLALKNKRIWFEYHSEFLTTPLAISPFKLPLQPGAIYPNDSIFEGLFGVFYDSLPDGWGRLLLDREVAHHGISSEILTSLDRLAYVGHQGMGALCYRPAYPSSSFIEKQLTLDRLAEEAKLVLESSSEVFFEELFALQGSSGGARPKITAYVSPDKKQIASHALSENHEPYLIKFPATTDPKDIGAIEFAYSHMARAAGIEMPETFLFSSQNSPGYFGSKRFDRPQNQRVHMHSLSGLLHADYRVPNLDYQDFLKATSLLTKDTKEIEKSYRLAVFNVLAHNRDDHSKNFSFLMDAHGIWRLAPAYDLTYAAGPAGEQSMMVLGEGKNPGIQELQMLGRKFEISHVDNIIETVVTSIQQWKSFADAANVSSSSREKIWKVIRA